MRMAMLQQLSAQNTYLLSTTMSDFILTFLFIFNVIYKAVTGYYIKPFHNNYYFFKGKLRDNAENDA